MSTTETPEIRWVRTDPASDLLNSLEHCLLAYKMAIGDERNWKWCVAAAHSAAQSAMVKVLVQDGQEEHLKKKSRKELLTYLNEGWLDPTKKYPWDKHLDIFMALYEACKKHLPDGTATPELDRDLGHLNEFRNEWTHFKVDGWFLPVGRARVATLAGIKLVKALLPTAPGYDYSEIDVASYELAVSSLLRLLSIAEIDTIQPPKIDPQIVERLAKLDSDHGA